MLFHTWEFAVFFVVVFGVFLCLQRTRAWMAWLGVASYFFYGWWNPYYLLLILYSTLLDYWVVGRMARCQPGGRLPWNSRRFWLYVSVVNNLGLLGFFKYADFCIENLNRLFASLGIVWSLPEAAELMPFGWSYLLPVGISFYTFQSLSYTIDFYRRRIPREPSFLRFATYVAFFPQLVAGPIERSQNLLPQLSERPTLSWQQVADGMSLFLVGLFKKVALANYLAHYVDRVYSQPGDYSSSALMLATFCFAWQIYFDFSGYTDMARGVARVMGFRLMLNFRHPYLATGLADFWARWHISLSTWFRDYVYIPLGGSRSGPLSVYRNLLLVFVISGFWHGSAWRFIIWGLWHGCGLCATRRLEQSAFYRQRIPLMIKRICVFLFVCVGWVFFRAETVADALAVLRGIRYGYGTDPGCPLLMLALVATVWIYEFLCESRWRRMMERGAINVPLACGMLVYLLMCAASGGEFIYFQF